MELIDLAKECLAAELEDRPRHAGAVSERIDTYQAGVQDRLRKAEIERAEEKARAEEATKRARVERDRLRLTIALAASVVCLLCLGGGGWAYLAKGDADRRAKMERGVTAAIDEANLLRGQAKAAAVGDLSKWPEAITAANKARDLLATGESNAALRERVETILALVKQDQTAAIARAIEVDRDRKFLERLEDIRVSRYDGFDWIAVDKAYSAAFREFGIDPDQLDPNDAGRRLSQRSNPVEMTFYLDDWALVRCYSNEGQKPNRESFRRRLIQTAKVADPHPWRNALRELIESGDGDALKRLAKDEKALEGQEARSLLLLAWGLWTDMKDELRTKILMRAWRLRPNDFLICSELALYQDVGFSTAAVALRPDRASTHYHLAHALLPSDMLGYVIPDERPPTVPENLDEAIAEYREALRIRPDVEVFHRDLAHALFYKEGSQDEAVSEYRKAIKMRPMCFENMWLIADLYKFGRVDEAIAECRDLLRLNPDHEMIRGTLAELLLRRGKVAEAFRTLSERNGSNEFMLESYLRRAGMVSEALAHYREMIKRSPADARYRNNLGYNLLEFGEVDEALSEIREFLRLEANQPHALDSLGWTQYARGELGEAIANLREADRIAKSSHPTIQGHLKHVERLSAIQFRLDAVLHGRDAPSDAEASLDVAELCRVTRRFAASARFYREAFQAKPALIDDLVSQHRLHAAIAAARAGTTLNRASDDLPLGDRLRGQWRAQAQEWLSADMGACAKIINGSTDLAAWRLAGAGRPPHISRLALARKTLDIIAHHRDLACVRDEDELKKLPEDERRSWQAFWAEVAALLKQAG
jgi:tetratricopeptide (TPR) repeat protein